MDGLRRTRKGNEKTALQVLSLMWSCERENEGVADGSLKKRRSMIKGKLGGCLREGRGYDGKTRQLNGIPSLLLWSGSGSWFLGSVCPGLNVDMDWDSGIEIGIGTGTLRRDGVVWMSSGWVQPLGRYLTVRCEECE